MPANKTETPSAPPSRPALEPKDALSEPSKGVFGWAKQLFRRKPDDLLLRETIEELIEVPDALGQDSETKHERTLLSNILKLRDTSVVNLMVPRAEIDAINIEETQEALLSILADSQFSRIPIYNGTLDDVLGTVHIKDILGAMAKGQPINLDELLTDIPIVSPAMSIPDFISKMKHTRRHMAMVVDEYGGIDGLITLSDVIEIIVGEIDDEHDREEEPVIHEEEDGSLIADARMELNEFEMRYGRIFSEEEREESDTLGGLVFSLAGRIPARGEVLIHNTGMVFEVTEASPRRISRLKIRNIPSKHISLQKSGD